MAGLPPSRASSPRRRRSTRCWTAGYPTAPRPPSSWPLVARLGAHGRLQRALPVGGVRPQARLPDRAAGRARAPAGSAVPRRPGAARRRRSPRRTGQPAARAAGRRATPTRCRCSRPRPGPGALARAGPAWRCRRSRLARRRGALRRPPAGSTQLQRRVAVGARPTRATGTSSTASTGCRAGHRRDPARFAAGLPGRDPRRRPGAARHGAADPRALAGGVAGLGHPGAGAGRRRRHDRRRCSRCASGSGSRRCCWSASPATASRCCSCCTARPTWRSPSSWSRR